MNKKISTPIAIGIILILSVALASFTVLQFSGINLETKGFNLGNFSLYLKSCDKLKSLKQLEYEKIILGCNNNEDCIIKHPLEGCIKKGSDTKEYDLINDVYNNKNCFPPKGTLVSIMPTIGCECLENKCVSVQNYKKDETVDWKTYGNEHGFTIKYPNSWKESKQLLGSGTRFEFNEQNGEAAFHIRIGTYYNQDEGKEITLKELIDGMRKSYEKETLKEENIFIDDVQAKKFHILWNEKTEGYLIFFQQEGGKNIIEIVTEVRNLEKKDEYLPVFDQMLSTFRFID